jgi:FtsH-binding integral membrane protein
MHRIYDVLARHLWLQFACGWVLATGAVLLVYPGRSPLSVLVRVVLCSAGAVWLAVRRRRREEAAAGGEADDLMTLDHMLRAGKVPGDPAQREAMSTLVDYRLRRTRHRTAALVFLGVMLAGVAVATVFATTALRAAAYCVFCAVVFGYCFVAGGMALDRLRRMREKLDATTGAGRPAPGGHPTRHAA